MDMPKPTIITEPSYLQDMPPHYSRLPTYKNNSSINKYGVTLNVNSEDELCEYADWVNRMADRLNPVSIRIHKNGLSADTKSTIMTVNDFLSECQKK
jgi:hypothetical protein